jgi:hypothetical protein
MAASVIIETYSHENSLNIFFPLSSFLQYKKKPLYNIEDLHIHLTIFWVRWEVAFFDTFVLITMFTATEDVVGDEDTINNYVLR